MVFAHTEQVYYIETHRNAKREEQKMFKIKKVIAFAMAGAMMFSLAGCKGSTAGNETKGTTSQEAVTTEGKTFNLKLGHNMAEDHAVHIELTKFADEVKEKSNGTINITIFPNGTLGSETDMISQIQNGALDMAKVSASTLGNFSNLYNAYSVPYVFDNKDHYYNVMDGDITENIFKSTEANGFIGLNWLDSGSRSFYTVDKPIRKPEDLKGLKIRTMDSQMAIDMMTALGGSATVMGYSDIYTGLQQGVIDGAENNVTALRDHGEVAKYYSFDEHTRIPDIIVLSSKVWNEMSPEQQETMKSCAKEATEDYKTAWADFENEVLDKATNDFGVELVRDVDIAVFQEAVQPIYEKLKTDQPDVYSVVEQIREMAE
jgi:tripartite ATP-independent transporter DctP family solute receptor